MFITFYKEIVDRLKTGSISNIVMFGNHLSKLAVPYLVIKPLFSIDRELFTFYVHVFLGEHEKLSEYILKELPELLKEPLERTGEQISIFDTRNLFGFYVDEADNTLAMTRDFYIPIIT